MSKFTSETPIREIAEEIYGNFALHQSCLITGFQTYEGRVVPRGELVLKELEAIDVFENTNTDKKDGRTRRKRVKLPNTIGGFVATKIFKYRKDLQDDTFRVTIWRIQ